MKITKTQLSQIVKEELNNAMQEGIPSQGDYELGRQHALAVSQGEMAEEDTYAKRLSDKDYERGFDEQTKELESWDDERVSDPEGGDDDWRWENKITKSQLAQIIKEELAAVDIEEGMMDKIGTKFRSMTGRSTPQDKYKHYIAKANKMILDLATFMFRKMDLDGAPDTTEELLKNPHGHDVRLSAIKKALKRSKLTRNDTIKKAVESLDNLIHDKNTDVALQYFAGGDDLEKFRGHPFMAAVKWIDSYDVDDVASALSRTWSNKRSGDDDRKDAIKRRNIDSERETTRRDRDELNQRVAAKKYQKQVAAERERELSRQGNRDNLSADTTMGAYRESLDTTKITKSQLAQIVQEELKATLSEAYSDTEYNPYWDEKAVEDARNEALWTAIDDSLENWAGTPAPIHEIIPGAPEGVNQIGWDEAGEEYLFGLVKSAHVVRVEGSPNDDWYGKEANLYVLAQ